jgi:hypothetical protein
MIAQRSANGKSRAIITGIRKGGERFPLKISSAIIQSDTGEDLTSVIATDVSATGGTGTKTESTYSINHKNFTRKKKTAACCWRAFSTASPMVFLLSTETGRSFSGTRPLKTSCGETEAELIGKNVWEEFPDLKVLQDHIDFKTLFEKNQSVRFREYFPGYRIWADVSAYPSDKNISVYFKDVTEVKNLRTLERLEREVLEMNARPNSILEDTLDFYLLQVQDIHKGMMCTVLRIHNNRIVQLVGTPSLSEHYTGKVLTE